MTTYLDLQTNRAMIYNVIDKQNIELNDSKGLPNQVSVIEQCMQHQFLGKYFHSFNCTGNCDKHFFGCNRSVDFMKLREYYVQFII